MTRATAVVAAGAVMLGGAAFITGRESEPVVVEEAPAPRPLETAVVVVPVLPVTTPAAAVSDEEVEAAREPPVHGVTALEAAPPPVRETVAAPAAPPELQSLATEVAAIAKEDEARSDVEAENAGHDEAVREALAGLSAAETKLASGDEDGLEAAIDAAADALGDSAQPLIEDARDRLANEDLAGVRNAIAMLLAASNH